MPPEIDLARRSHAMLVRAMEVDPPLRRAFAHEHCAGDPALLTRLLELLDAADRSDRFLDRPALAPSPIAPDPSTQIPDAVGEYLIVGVLGAGGMATVYEAIQENPKRRVALKVMHQWMAHPDAYTRFRFETEALARLHHPGIAQIYEVGAAHLGQPAPAPFFAMELILGAAPITAYAARRTLPLRDRLAMLASVCDAVHHGHQHGIIHRDLKPANVLVDAEGRAKVIDFGVARGIDPGPNSPTALTGARQLIGTLNYMSPEQCGATTDLDIRTDVYSLGVMLYELVCGRLPHDLASLPLPAALHAIVHDPPQRPQPQDPRAGRDLEAIILKAIDKDPDRRYDSASALATDLRHLLAHRPTEARPPGVLDQCRLLLRRHRAPVLAGLAIAASLLALAVISTIFAFRLSSEVSRRRLAEHEANGQRDAARWQAYTANIAGALSAMNTGEFVQMRTRLAAASDQHRTWEWGFLSRTADRSATTTAAHHDMIMDMAVSHDWTRYATAALDGSIRLWDASTGALMASRDPDGNSARADSIAFTPDSRRLITGDADGALRLLDATDLRELPGGSAMPTGVRAALPLPGDRIAIALDRGPAMVRPLNSPDATLLPDEQPGGVQGLALSPDASLLATFNDDGHLWIRDTADLHVVHQLEYPGSINQVRFSPDGRFIAAAGSTGRVLVWNVADATLWRDLQATAGVNTVRSLAFSCDGQALAAGLIHRGIVILSLADGKVLGELGGHTEAVSALHFSPDDSLLVSASWDGTIRTWRRSDFSSPGGITTLTGHLDHIFALAFSPDGSTLASASSDTSLRLWDPDTATQLARLAPTGASLAALAFSPDGLTIAVGGGGDGVALLDAQTGRTLAMLPGHDRGIASLAFDSTSKRLAVGASDGTIHVWDLTANTQQLAIPAHTARINSVRFSPDGSLIASGSRNHTARLFNSRTGDPLPAVATHDSDVFAVLFSPDGHQLYTGSRNQTVRVWDVATGACLKVLAGHGQYVTCLALSPDGSRLAAGSWFGEIVLFNVATLDLIASLRAHDAAIRGVAFSPDGRWLASASYDATIHLFDSATLKDADAARADAQQSLSNACRRFAAFLGESLPDPVTLRDELARAGLDPRTDPWIRKAVLSIFSPVEAP